jgi:hypothetical protein
MPADMMVAFATGLIIALITTHQSISRAIQAQQQILKEGVRGQGRVLRIWQPPVLNTLCRVHFEFQPDGSDRVVRTCHVDRRSGGLVASRPAVGATVTVHYLPENPAQAVIAKLVPRV